MLRNESEPLKKKYTHSDFKETDRNPQPVEKDNFSLPEIRAAES